MLCDHTCKVTRGRSLEAPGQKTAATETLQRQHILIGVKDIIKILCELFTVNTLNLERHYANKDKRYLQINKDKRYKETERNF